MKTFKRDVRTTSRVRVVATEIRDPELTMRVKYMFNPAVSFEYEGMPHMYEHLVFSNLIPGCSSGMDTIEYAKQRGVDISASTSLSGIEFVFRASSLYLPSEYPGSRSINRYKNINSDFDKVDLIMYIFGSVIKKHQFGLTEVNREKSIICAEIESATSQIIEGFNKLTGLILGLDGGVASTKERIQDANLELINNFASDMHMIAPQVFISYPEDNCDFKSIVSRVHEQLSYLDDSEITCDYRSSMSSPFENLDIINSTLPKEPRNPKFIKSPTRENSVKYLGILNSHSSIYDVDDVYENILGACVSSLLLDVDNTRSLGYYLREKLGILYGMASAGVVKTRDYVNVCADIGVLDTNMSKTELMNSITKFMHNVEDPTDDEILSELVPHLRMIRTINLDGINAGTASRMTCKSTNPDDVISAFTYANFPFVRADFLRKFREVKDNLMFVLL